MTAKWQVEHLAAADVDGGLALSTQAGWNQTTADWAYLLKVGHGFGVRADGGLIATSLALPYPPHFGWVSMVLVTERYRRQGLATLLLQTAINHLQERGLVPMLDATPEGRAVYSQLGFVDVEQIDRWQAVLSNKEAYRPTHASILTSMHHWICRPSGLIACIC